MKKQLPKCPACGCEEFVAADKDSIIMECKECGKLVTSMDFDKSSK